jgi:hypothetical protein
MSDLIAQTLANPAIGAFGTAVVLAVIALWLAGAWWAYADASRRAESSLAGFVAAGWIILSTPLLLPLSLAVYAFSRPQVTAADRRTRALAYELAMAPERPACATCAAPVEDAWLRCPSCTSWLAAPCSDCGGWSDASLQLCPWCGGEERDAPYVAVPSEVAAGLAPRNRRRLASRALSPTVPRSQLRESRDGRDARRLSLTPGGAKSSLRRA